MKNKILNSLIILSCIFFFIEVIINKNMIFSVVNYSIDIWINNIIPSLFPSLIISSILINYNITSYIPFIFKKFFMNLFNISEYSLSIFFLSMISGFPSSGKYILSYYNMGLINIEEANHILLFSHFSNPLFILSTVSVLFFKDHSIGIPILLSHYLANVILGILIRNKSPYNTNNNYTNINNKSQNFGIVFYKSVKGSIDTLLLIFGTLTCFLIISSIIIHLFSLNGIYSIIVKSFLEITMGLNELSKLNLNSLCNIILSSMIISFGGLSIHMQIISQLSDYKINYLRFFRFRIYHCVTASIIGFIFYYI